MLWRWRSYKVSIRGNRSLKNEYLSLEKKICCCRCNCIGKWKKLLPRGKIISDTSDYDYRQEELVSKSRNWKWKNDILKETIKILKIKKRQWSSMSLEVNIQRRMIDNFNSSDEYLLCSGASGYSTNAFFFFSISQFLIHIYTFCLVG